MLKLNNTIKVMVPTKDNDGKEIDYMTLVQNVTSFVGGSTMYDAQGLWVSNDKTYKDSNKLVEFNMDDESAYLAVYKVFESIVEPLISDGGQLAVWLQVNSTTYIIHKVLPEEIREVAETLPDKALEFASNVGLRY